MTKYFYTHIINKDDIHSELDLLDIADEEKNHLLLIIESSMHHVVIDALLTEMVDDHKETFLVHLSADNHDEIWKLLNKNIDNPEQKILKVVDNLKIELLGDIKNVKLR